ncbi:MAG: DUF4232 domain-containing protein [Candidatus Dormibacteria bacterium]
MSPKRHRLPGLPRVGPVACISLVALGGALAACEGVSQTHPPSQPTSIPWVATPGHAVVVLQAGSAYRVCGPGDLSVTVGPRVAFLGDTVENLRLTNVSTTECELSSPPTVTWQLASGGTATAADGVYSDVTVDLAPGESATFDVGAPATCASYESAAPKLASPISAALPGGGTLPLSNAARLDLQCGPPQVELFFADEPTAAPTRGKAAVQVALNAPSSVSVGTTYRYTVTLTNPTKRTISLLPCPSYSEGLTGTQGAQRILNSATYVLNCQSVGHLGPGASATFRMNYPVPVALSPGPAKFWWWMQVPSGPLGGMAVELS